MLNVLHGTFLRVKIVGNQIWTSNTEEFFRILCSRIFVSFIFHRMMTEFSFLDRQSPRRDFKEVCSDLPHY